MTERANNLMPRHTIGVLAFNAFALIAFACSPVAQEYPLAVLSILAFMFVQAFFPACRICFETPLCPSNIAQGLHWVQLVLATVLIGFYGFSLGTLPYLPAKNAINLAIVIHVVGYLSFCTAYQQFSGKTSNEPLESTPRRELGMAYLILPFAAVGVLGLFLTHGSVGGFIEYATSPLQHRLNELEPATLEGAAGSFLRHFLGFAIVLAWSVWLGRPGTRSKWLSASVTAGVVLMLLVANFTYNRGAMLVPILAVAASYSVHVSRIPFKGVLLGGALAMSVAFTFGWYRSTNLEITEVSTSDVDETWDAGKLVDFTQIYASAPQLAGYMIEALDRDNQFYYGRTIFPSLVYPIPALGKPYRESSGVVIFNNLIYGDIGVLDQNIPLDGELYVNFHFPGVVLGNLLLGWLVSLFQRKFLTASSAIESYIWLLLAVWTVFPGSLPVASQMYVYSFWPIYGYGFAKILCSWNPLARCSESRGPDVNAATLVTN